MWIVRLALRRPYTFVVASILLLLVTPFVLLRTPTDIFPSINIPVVSIIWQYAGLTARDIEQRLNYSEERALTTTVNNIEHIESTAYDGVGVIKVFFQRGVSPEAGVAQITAVSQTILKQLPPGTTPPLVIEYNASTVPIMQYGISSKTLSEEQTYDVALNTIRVGLISVPGVGIPLPYGGKVRVVSVDLDPKALEAQNLSEQDVVDALSSQNLVFPSGTAKVGANEYPVDLNTSPSLIHRLNGMPIKTVGGAVIRVQDVAEAETVLKTTQAQLPAVALQRAQFEHALALLVGQSAATFRVPERALSEAPPWIPSGLPSELLERRPDISAAERRMAAANADIGVAKAAFFPTVQLNGLAGLESVNAGTLFNWSSRMWAVGPSLTLPLFEGGRLRAGLRLANASYEEMVANYRQSVLTAFSEVEDSLAAQILLADQYDAQSEALLAARKQLEIANNRYRDGLTTYLDVATAESTELNIEFAATQLRGQQLVAAVTLVKSLGGGWRESN